MNSNQREFTPAEIEQQEREEAIAIQEKIDYDIRIGKILARLRTNPDFKELIEKIFIEQGKKILWENVVHLTEVQLTDRGNDKNLEIIEAIKGQVKSRLDFEGFMDTIEYDADAAKQEPVEQEQAAKEAALEVNGDPLAQGHA